MKRMTLPMIGIAALGFSCSQAPPPQPAAPPPPSTQPADGPEARRAQLRAEETELATKADSLKKKYEELERNKEATLSAIDAALSQYLQSGGQLHAVREKIIALEARLSSAKIPSEQDRGLAEISQRETEEKILTLTALVTELQVDMYGKRALYDALKGDPNSPKKALREARKNYREAVEQLRTLKESLAEARAEQMEFDLREAKRRQRPGEPKADSRFLSQESEQTILTLTALVTQLQKDMLRKKAIYDALSYAKPDTLPITAELQNLLNQDPFINQLENRLHTAEEKLKATRRFGVNHRVCKAAQVARDVAADRVTEERARKISEYHRGQIEQAKRNFLEAQEQLVTLKDRLIEAKSKQMQLDALEARRQRDAAQRAKENASTP